MWNRQDAQEAKSRIERRKDAPHPGPESPHPDAQRDAAKPMRSRWRKILTPVGLAAFGLVIFLLAILIYPSAATGVAAPLYSRLEITTTSSISFVIFSIIQVSPAAAEMKVSLELPSATSAAPTNAPTATLAVDPPIGTTFQKCPAPSCRTLRETTIANLWTQLLHFTDGRASADFFVNARSFGVAFNGINASAAIPEVQYHGPGAPMLLVAYNIPSAASYEWSSFPIAGVTNETATWQEDVTSDTPGREAVGVNPSGQASHDTRLFIAGALIGLAGAAILSGVQEALHAFD